jgi:hypothetical protein
VAVLVLAALILAPGSALATYTKDIYNSANNNTEAKDCWCVVAAVRSHLKYIPNSTVPTQTSLNTTITAHDRYDWTGGTCPGHDPRGWAYGLYLNTPGNYAFNDYGYGSQSTADWELVYGIRATSQPAGALVAAGRHAYDVVGFKTANDPFSDLTQSLTGFYVIDPWYPHAYATGFGAAYDGPPSDPNYGLPPNTYIAIATWNSTFLKKNVNDGAFWLNQYTVVLREIDNRGVPQDVPGQSYGDHAYAGLGLAAAAATSGDSTATLADPVIGDSIAAAVTKGITGNGLLNDPKFGSDLRRFKVGASIHVTSLASELPSYDLVELRVAGSTRAIAMVQEVGGRFEFGALSQAPLAFDLFSAAGRARILAENHMAGTGELVWGWTIDGPSPFTPFIRGVDASTGRPAFATAMGRKDAIDLSEGFTPRR